MNKKHFLAVGLFAAMFTACTQEEIATSPLSEVDLSNRPTVGSPMLGVGASTRLGVNPDKAFNAILWENGVDGVGACIIDKVAKLDATTWAGKYTITPGFISSNYQYLRNAAGQFGTTALMVEGNYMFYAPYNKGHLTRNAISINLPLVQHVTKEMPNKPIDELYKSGFPAVVGYKALMAENQDKDISVDMQHIFAYPQFTLKNSFTVAANNKDVPTDITVVKVELSLTKSEKFIVNAPVDNAKLLEQLTPYDKADIATAKSWLGPNSIETAATVDILSSTLSDANKADKITVDFGTGIVIKAGESFPFYAVLPAADYKANKIQATIYTSDNKRFSVPFVAGSMFMNPGKRYPAEEYNTTGEPKPTKGTLATLELKGKLVDAGTPVIPTEISNKYDFIAYLANVATRYRDLKQVTTAFTELNTAATAAAVGAGAEAYDRGLHFVLTPNAKLVIDDEVIDALIKYIYKEDVQPNPRGSVTFLAEDVKSGKVIIGDATKLGQYTISFQGKAELMSAGVNPVTPAYVKLTDKEAMPSLSISGNVTLTGTTTLTAVTVPTGATLTLDKALDGTSLVVTNAGGTIEWNGGEISSIVNNEGTLSINQDYTGSAAVSNGTDTKVGTIKIAANVSIGSVITNKAKGVIENSGFMYADNVNNGIIKAMIKGSTTKVAASTKGIIENNVLSAVTLAANDASQTVKYTATNLVSGKLGFAEAAAINYVVLTKGWTVTEAADITSATTGTTMPATIEFAGGTFTTPVTAAFANTTELIFSAANTIWMGNAGTKPTLTGAKVTVEQGKRLTLKHIAVTAASGSTPVNDVDATTNATYKVQ